MHTKRERLGSGLTRGRAFPLGLLGVVLVCLVMSGCSGGGSDGSIAGTSGLFRVEASGTFGIKPTYRTCGEDQEETLWRLGNAEARLPIGIVEIANDLDNLYVKYELSEGWGIEGVRLDVGENKNDYPQYPNKGYYLGGFRYGEDADPGTVWEEWEQAIEFSQVPYNGGVLSHGACGMTVYIFAWAKPVPIDADDETNFYAWGGTDLLTTDSPWLMYYIPYEIQCCYGGGGEFRTQSQGGWGTVCHGWNPGCYRDEWFDTAFPEGLTIGCDAGYTMTFRTIIEDDITGSEAVAQFIPSGGKPGPLQQDYENPTGKTEAGVLASQVLALALNLGFDAVDPNFGSSDDMLADQVICGTGTAFDDWTVQALFDEANLVLGGCPSTYAPGQIVEALTIVNENYVDGEVDGGSLCPPE